MKNLLSWITVIALLATMVSVFMLPAEAANYYTYTEGSYEFYLVSGPNYSSYATIYKYHGSASVLETPRTLKDHKVDTIGASSFSDCTTLTEVTVDSQVETIGHYAFRRCYNLEAVTLSGVLKSIGWGVFEYCESLKNIVIPNGVTSIGEGAFRGCISLEDIKIPTKVVEISKGTFQDCKSLAKVELPSGVTSIGEEAFSGCTGLTSIYIPSGVTTIGLSAFAGCESLTDVYYGGSEESWNNSVEIKSSNDPLLSANIHFDCPVPTTTTTTTTTTTRTTTRTAATTTTTTATQPTQPTTEPYHEDEPTEPTFEPTEPAFEPTEPTFEPTEPTFEPTEPTFEPTEPYYTEPFIEPIDEPTEPYYTEPYYDDPSYDPNYDEPHNEETSTTRLSFEDVIETAYAVINRHRVQAGLAELTVSDALERKAQAQADDFYNTVKEFNPMSLEKDFGGMWNYCTEDTSYAIDKDGVEHAIEEILKSEGGKKLLLGKGVVCFGCGYNEEDVCYVICFSKNSSGDDTLFGDANDDGLLNMKDILVLRKYIADIAVNISLDAADYNCDRKINMKDVLGLRKSIAAS